MTKYILTKADGNPVYFRHEEGPYTSVFKVATFETYEDAINDATKQWASKVYISKIEIITEVKIDDSRKVSINPMV